MANQVAINRFGRIGSLTFRHLMEQSNKSDVVAVNDWTDTKTLATLLNDDTTFTPAIQAPSPMTIPH